MSKVRFFVYQKGTQILIETHTQRELKDNSLDQLRVFHTIQDCRAWVRKEYAQELIEDRVKQKNTGFTTESKAKMAARIRLLASRSNYWKKSEAFKKKVSKTMTGTRQGSYNPNFGKLGKKRKPSTKYVMSITRRGKKWCVDEQGIEHFVFPNFVLPKGWAWGRNTRKWDRI